MEQRNLTKSPVAVGKLHHNAAEIEVIEVRVRIIAAAYPAPFVFAKRARHVIASCVLLYFNLAFRTLLDFFVTSPLAVESFKILRTRHAPVPRLTALKTHLKSALTFHPRI